jgi:hypothetical protein
MRKFGWAVAVVVGGYSAYVFIKSIPDMVRYVKLASM